jgi:hypothetical protein
VKYVVMSAFVRRGVACLCCSTSCIPQRSNALPCLSLRTAKPNGGILFMQLQERINLEAFLVRASASGAFVVSVSVDMSLFPQLS